MSASEPPTVRRRRTEPAVAAAIPGESLLVLDRYRLHRRLGAGGFGVVWLARDERLERDVAVKIVPRERVEGGRFEREARAAARLAHPAIVTLYEAAIDDQGAYLVSELVRGTTLDRRLEAGRLSDREIVVIGLALCDALAHAHSKGIVHRDVKPSNILVPERPSSPAQIAKLTDFGVARVISGDSPEEPGGHSLTCAGEVIGTAAYMAPEQAEGHQAGSAADLFSLAIVIYEALTGVNPIAIGSPVRRARRLGACLPPLRHQRRDLPLPLAQGIDLALRSRPRERGSLGELHQAMSAALGQLDDQPGVVASAWPARSEARARREGGAELQGRLPADRGPLPAWLARGLSGLAAGALSAWLAAHVLTSAPIAPVGVGLLAAILISALPRAGWLALALAFALASTLQHHPGAALAIALGAGVPVVLAPFSPGAWPLGAGGPALGLLGVAGAWPAVAARARSAPRRAALACVGWAWLVLASPLAGTGLYLPGPRGTPRPDAWAASLHQTVNHVLGPLVSSCALAPAAVWALAAVVLPWLVRRRSLGVDALRVVAWSVALAGATIAVLGGAHGGSSEPAPGTVLVGAAAGAVVALAPSLRSSWRARREPPSRPRTGLA